MHFEVYVDSLLVLQFVMNCYLLALVNKMLRQTVSLKRILGGAFGGAVLAVIPYLLPLKVILSVGLSFFLSTFWMSVVTFRTYRRESFLRVLEKLAISTILLGGSLMVLLRILPKGREPFLGVIGVLMAGGVVYGLISLIVKRGNNVKNIYKVTLFGKETVTVEALLDTGNSLAEPISGKPVAVLDREVFENVFGEDKPAVFRIIPYHSIGKKSGVLSGYLLDKIVVETEEGTKEYKEVYIGISDDIISEVNGYKMILHPEILN